MSKKDFSKNMKPKKKKLTDEAIDAFDLDDIKKDVPKKKNKLIRFSIRLPEVVYNELNEEAERMGMSKKFIVMQGLTTELRKIKKQRKMDE